MFRRMTANNNIMLQMFTYCLLIGFTHALIGKRVHLAKSGQSPFVVSITKKVDIVVYDIQQFHLCTGTLIRPKSVLTVAHCLNGRIPALTMIIAGSVNIKEGKRYNPESWITFDQWNQDKTWKYRMNDIAVITLHGDGITEIVPAIIPLRFHNNLNDHTHFTIAGWGETDRGNKVAHLRTALLYLISNRECSENGKKLKSNNFAVPENYFCSKADPYVVSSCGDGGAPIFTRDTQVIGINIGTCPNLEGYLYNSVEFLHQNVMNSHLHISYYKNFIEHVWI